MARDVFGDDQPDPPVVRESKWTGLFARPTRAELEALPGMWMINSFLVAAAGASAIAQMLLPTPTIVFEKPTPPISGVQVPGGKVTPKLQVDEWNKLTNTPQLNGTNVRGVGGFLLSNGDAVTSPNDCNGQVTPWEVVAAADGKRVLVISDPVELQGTLPKCTTAPSRATSFMLGHGGTPHDFTGQRTWTADDLPPDASLNIKDTFAGPDLR